MSARLRPVAAALALIAAFAAWAPHARASGPARRVPLDPSAKLAGLQWPSDEIEVESEPYGEGDFKTYAILVGKYVHEGWTLLWGGGQNVPVSENGEFRIRVPIQGDTAKIKLLGVGPLGELEEEPTGISFPDYEAYRKELREEPPKVSYLSGGLSMTSISYAETATPGYSSISLTGKVNYQRLILPPNWDFSATAYLTLLPVTKSSDATARFLGVNVRAGYVLPQVTDPWRVSILAGAYYTTMIVTNNQFGFRNLAGPQLYPTVRRALGKKQAVAAYLKYSPVSDGLNVLALSNREIAFGGAYSRTLRNGHPLSVSADIASLSLTFAGISITSNSLSFGASYGL